MVLLAVWLRSESRIPVVVHYSMACGVSVAADAGLIDARANMCRDELANEEEHRAIDRRLSIDGPPPPVAERSTTSQLGLINIGVTQRTTTTQTMHRCLRAALRGGRRRSASAGWRRFERRLEITITEEFYLCDGPVPIVDADAFPVLQMQLDVPGIISGAPGLGPQCSGLLPSANM